MHKKRSLRQFLPIVLAMSALFSSCKDETGTLGLDVLPTDDLFSGTDVVSQLPVTNDNPVRMRSDDASYAMIGSIDDPYAGKTDASFITQVTIGEFNGILNQSDSIHEYYVDSLVLNLAYQKNWWFGDKNARHNVKVYRFNGALPFTENYYSDMPVEGLYDETPVAERISSGWDALPDSIWDDNSYVHQWQFKLEDAVAQEVFNYKEDTMLNRDLFKEIFGAFYVKSELIDADTKGSLVAFDLLSSQSNMELFYSYDILDSVTNEVDTTMHTSYIFPINVECMRINKFTHDNSSSIDFNNPDAGQFVVQGMAGSRVKIDLNDVMVPDENNQLVNLFDYWKQKLSSGYNTDEYSGISAVDIFFKADTTLQYSDDNFYSPVPPTLVLSQLNEKNELEIPQYSYDEGDDSNWSVEFSGGNFNSETGEYQFRLVGESFRMMVEKPELRGPFYLTSPEPVSYPWRVILQHSQSNESITPNLHVKYVTIQTP